MMNVEKKVLVLMGAGDGDGDVDVDGDGDGGVIREIICHERPKYN